MAALTIRNLDDALKRSLRIRAASRSHSMEEEARQILRAALLEKVGPTENLGSRIRDRFAALGGVDLPDVDREAMRPPPTFEQEPNPAVRSSAKRRPKASPRTG